MATLTKLYHKSLTNISPSHSMPSKKSRCGGMVSMLDAGAIRGELFAQQPREKLTQQGSIPTPSSS